METKSVQLPDIDKIKLYKIRWLVLAIFVLYSASNSIQWIQFSIISDVIVKYYGVSTTWVDWTSMIYMVLYIPFVFPASYFLEKLVMDNHAIINCNIILFYVYYIASMTFHKYYFSGSQKICSSRHDGDNDRFLDKSGCC